MIAIIISIFFIISLFALFPLKNKRGELVLYVSIGVLLVLTSAFRGDSVDNDYKAYLFMYNQIVDGITIMTEPTFVWIVHLTAILGNPILLFVIYAIIGVSLKLIAIRTLTELWYLSLVVYISNFYILHEMTQIRAGVAAGLLLLCIKPIYERDWKRFLLFSVVAFLFHASAIIILPLWILGCKNPRKLLLALSIPFAYLVYFSKINLVGVIPIPGVEEKILMYQRIQELGKEGFMEINVFNKVFLIKVLIFYLLLWKYEVIMQYNKYCVIFMKIFCISLLSFPVFAVMPVIGFRVSELLGVVEIVLFPFIYYIFNPRIISRSIIVFFCFVILSISIFYNKLII